MTRTQATLQGEQSRELEGVELLLLRRLWSRTPILAWTSGLHVAASKISTSLV